MVSSALRWSYTALPSTIATSPPNRAPPPTSLYENTGYTPDKPGYNTVIHASIWGTTSYTLPNLCTQSIKYLICYAEMNVEVTAAA